MDHVETIESYLQRYPGEGLPPIYDPDNLFLMENQTGPNILMLAVMRKKMSLIKYLIEIGADVNKEDSSGFTPLMYACLYAGSNDIIEYLLEHGADVNHISKNGTTPSSCAHSKAIKHLLEIHGAIN